MSLQAPPKSERPSRIVARFVILIILALTAGIVIYTAVTNQAADLSEDVRLVSLELDDSTIIDDFIINARVDEGGPEPVVILHDVDVTGGLPLEELAAALPPGYHGVRIDMPGFGYSTRMPDEGPHHTVAGLAERLVPVLDERFGGRPVHVIGVGLGGEVGAELALTNPGLVSGLTMVDVDFWSEPGFPESLESLPWVGRAATYTWETGGRLAVDHWSPHCQDDGWCPTADELSARSTIVEIEGTTDSLHSFRRTPEAALAPSNLDEIIVPITYVWSSRGSVDKTTIDRLTSELPDLAVTESVTFQAALEDPVMVAKAFESIVER